LFIEFETFTIIFHFGLTGYLSTQPNHSHLRYTFGFENKSLYYYDTRNFGHIGLMNTKNVLEYKTDELGIDIFDLNIFTSSSFEKVVNRSKNKNICTFLLDQKKLAGIGNYAKSEILYHSKLSPFRTMNTLTPEEIYSLYTSICFVVYSCYAAGFAKDREKEYYNIFDNLNCSHENIIKNESKEFLHIINGLKKYTIQVYNTSMDLLGNRVVKTETPDHRTTYWVPSIQG
jgi:formamidopyrimidine-DNA glycosylase